MKLIKSNFEILDQRSGIEGIYKQIELAGRVSYKSEDKITEDSAKKFVDMLIKKGHTSVLEHGTVYLRDTYDISEIGSWRRSLGNKYDSNKYSEVITDESADFRNIYITTNLRVLYENNWLDDLKYLCEPTEYHEKRITVKFICDRGISHEFVRHRVFSFAQESTRYCNYSKDKFGKELTFIAPLWLELPNGHYHLEKHRSKIDDASCYYTEDNTEGKRNYHHIKTFNDYIYSLEVAEQSYLNLLNQGWIPQQARSVLPNCLKTELVMTGTVNQWKEFFVLRDTKSAHPQAYELAHSLHIEFIKKGYIHE